MDPTRRRHFRRAAFVLCAVLVAPVLPVPGFSTELVAAAETVDLPTLRPAGEAELTRIEAAAESDVDGSQRLVGQDSDLAEFNTIGVSLDSMPAEPILVRVKEVGGGWGDWQELGVEAEEGPDLGSPEAEASTLGTEPLWVDAADGYEVSLGAQDADAAEVVVVREHERTVVVEGARAGASLPPLQGMHYRGEWGARAPKQTPTIASTVKLAVVHHSVSPNGYSPSQVPSVLRGIQAYHMDGRGWDDIGYNFVVDRYGGIWEGRGGGAERPVVGAHASGFNSGSVGVMMLGDFSGAQPTSAAVHAAGTVTGWKLALHDSDPAGRVSFTSAGSPKYAAGTTVDLPRVVGHRDVGLTSCPGHAADHLGSVRARASAVYPFVRALLTPEGAVESVVGGSGRVTVSGWAVDRSSAGPASVRTAAGPVRKTTLTTLSRPDIEARFGGDGKAGFTRTHTGVPPGMQQVCTTVSSGLGRDRDRKLGCVWTLVGDPTGKSPVGRFEAVTATPGQIHVSGWALDPETSVPVTADLVVDGIVGSTVKADLRSSSVPRQYAALGPARRFKASAVAVTAGNHTVCMRARNQGAGVNTLVDCRVLKVPAHSPGGALETVSSRRPGKVDVSGWALDLESRKPINVLLVVGGRWHLQKAGYRRDDIAALYPGYGANHGLSASVSAPAGRQTVCAYGINVAGGANKLIGCRRVVVVK